MKSKILLITTVSALMVLAVNGVFAQTMLYHTDFSPAQTTLSVPVVYNAYALEHNITAIKVSTGVSGPITPGKFTKSVIGLRPGVPTDASTISNHMTAEIVQVPGPTGSTVYSLLQTLKINNAGPPTWGSSQSPFLIYYLSEANELGDFYYTYWLKFQSDLHDQIGTNTPLAGDVRMENRWSQ
ncbi:MAG: hypothetical protein Q8N05_03755 [Bacteroidota bacterium]|nr:hypothetical protein [Bacteroidota bacterium]